MIAQRRMFNIANLEMCDEGHKRISIRKRRRRAQSYPQMEKEKTTS